MLGLPLGQPRPSASGAEVQAAQEPLHRNRAAKAGGFIAAGVFGAVHLVFHFTFPLADLALHAAMIGSVFMGVKANV